MSNICAGIGRGQMTVADEHIRHHQHIQQLYERLLGDIRGITVHKQPSERYDSNYWLCTVMLDPTLKIVGQEDVYGEAIKGTVGGVAGVTRKATELHTACEPNNNVEALRVALDKAGIEARPLWKPMHKQPVYVDSPAYTNGISEEIFKKGLCLPSGPCVSDEDVSYIVEQVRAAIR